MQRIHEPALTAYLLAKEWVIRSGYEDEIHFYESRSLDRLTESDFLREMAWVILSTGMRESVVRKKFPHITEAFVCWHSASAIMHRKDQCTQAALHWFRHTRKIDAIIDAASYVFCRGFPSIHRSIQQQGVQFLGQFRFIGPVTQWHLAKNIGLDVVKPDRHLVRIAAACGCPSPDALCRQISNVCGEKVSVVDVVLWRFATLRSDYLNVFSDLASR